MRTEHIEFSGTALVRWNPWRIVLSDVPLVLGLIGVVTSYQRGKLLRVLFALCLVQIGLILRNTPPWERDGRLIVHPEGIDFDGRRLVDRASIHHALLVPRPDQPPLVRIVRRGLEPSIDLRVRDDQQGQQLMQALGQHASQSVAVLSLPLQILAHPMGSIMMAGLAITVLVGGMAIGASPMTCILVFAAITIARSLLRTHLHVGTDGLVIDTLGMRKYVQFRDLVKITRYESSHIKWTERGLDLMTLHGEHLRLPVEGERGRKGYTVEMVERRILEGMVTHAASDHGDEQALTEQLVPQGRDASAWIQSLRTLGAGSLGGMRHAPIPLDRLWRVLENPSMTPLARIGAAVALTASASVDRPRIATIARSAAAPRLRVALEASLEGQDAALASALDALLLEDAEAQKAAAAWQERKARANERIVDDRYPRHIAWWRSRH
ncbi:hypothetical protein [Chondromyces crocatus]|uniref:Uncharacterized protein n=1 Tax=Chondromyces crocatus TaxID=52 RepID=A0A0K1EH17_CHOCO|nr:hypothetical protein [Chondromyces crocatus]AKT40139.1 uncharacterized protein CMC5_042920 [Chondromyces crocatus]